MSASSDAAAFPATGGERADVATRRRFAGPLRGGQ